MKTEISFGEYFDAQRRRLEKMKQYGIEKCTNTILRTLRRREQQTKK